MSYNFILNGCDTDSIMFSKVDGTMFTKEEQRLLLEELNSLFPKGISWEHDGLYPAVVYLRAKNYILKDESGKVKKKGSSITDKKREPALREFIDKVITVILEDNDQETLKSLYTEYAKEIMNLQDIKRWVGKKTITQTIFESERLNETKIRDIIVGTDYRIADKIYTFYLEDDSLCLVENFTGDYSKDRLLEKLFKTGKLFETVLDTKTLFKNYSLKKNKKELESLL